MKTYHLKRFRRYFDYYFIDGNIVSRCKATQRVSSSNNAIDLLSKNMLITRLTRDRHFRKKKINRAESRFNRGLAI